MNKKKNNFSIFKAKFSHHFKEEMRSLGPGKLHRWINEQEFVVVSLISFCFA